MVQTPARGHCTSTALRNALPLLENSVSRTCLTAVDRLHDRDAPQDAAALAQRTTGRRCWWRRRRSAAGQQHHDTPRPGTWRSPIERVAAAGSTACDAAQQPAEHAVEHAEHRCSTQMVMASGTRPAGRRSATSSGADLVAGRGWRQLPDLPDGGAGAAGVVRGRRCRSRRSPARSVGGLGRAVAVRFAGARVGSPSCRSALVPSAGFWPSLLSPRKSVTYQPEPLSWKPAAVTCLAKPRRRRPGRRSAAGRTSSAARPSRGRRSAAIGVDRHRRASEMGTTRQYKSRVPRRGSLQAGDDLQAPRRPGRSRGR